MGLTQKLGTIPLAIQTDSSNNVGIGLTPNTWFSGYKVLEMGSGSLVFPNNATNTQLWNNLFINAAGNPTYKSNGIGGMFSLGGGGNAAVWYTAPSGTAGTTATLTQAMTLDIAGFVGIGTGNPSAFQSAARNLVIGSGVSENFGITIFSGSTTAGSIHFADEQTSGPASYRGYINYTHSTDSMQFGTLSSERMRITSEGNVLINKTSQSNVKFYVRSSTQTSSDYTIYADNSVGDLFWIRNDGAISTGNRAASPYNNTTATGANLAVLSDGTLARSTSSIKYKNNVQDYTKGLDVVMQLRPVSYTSKNPREEGQKFAGLIAEEVHDLGLTEFVQYADDKTPDALAYSHMVVLLTKAIQELNAKVTALENK